MMTPTEALDCLAAAYNCPDVALSETVKLIQDDARQDLIEELMRLRDVVSPVDVSIIDKVLDI